MTDSEMGSEIAKLLKEMGLSLKGAQSLARQTSSKIMTI